MLRVSARQMGKHKQECQIKIQEIIGGRQGGCISQCGKVDQIQITIYGYIADKGKGNQNLGKTPDSFFKDHRNRFILAQQQSPGNHKEYGDGNLDPERNKDIKREPARMLHGNVQRKTGRGGMGEHNQPDTENSQKFDMQQLFLYTDVYFC